jgi:hypothetical protein
MERLKTQDRNKQLQHGDVARRLQLLLPIFSKWFPRHINRYSLLIIVTVFK